MGYGRGVSRAVRRGVGMWALVTAGVYAVAEGGGTGGEGGITGPMISALEGAGDGILAPVGALLGVLVTVAIGFAIVRTIRS